MAVDVSIIIVNYKTIDLVRDCVASIQKFTSGINYEIIVVDNASEDISALKSEKTATIQLDKNIGFGGANNCGAEAAKGDVLFFLNPDTLLLNNAVKILFDAMKTLPHCGICGANVYDAELKPHHSYNYCTMTLKHGMRCMFIPSGKLSHISRQHNFSEQPKAVEYITGADLMISRQLFEDVGGFNRNIFMYYEDVDLCFKVRSRKLRCYSVPEARIQHFEGQSFNPLKSDINDVIRRKREMSSQSMAIFLRDNYSKTHRKAILSLNIFQLQMKSLIKRLMSKKDGGARLQLEFFRDIKHRL